MESNNRSMKACWGIDVGGSYVKIGYIADEVFTIVDKLPTGINCNPMDMLKRTAEVILKEDSAPLSVGLGTAGLIDHKAGGIIRFSPNLPLWSGINPGAILRKYIDAPVKVDNDCNVFAIGAIGSGLIPRKGLWLVITLGTGIGGTIINNGSILYGSGYAGEFGHTTVKENGIPCVCGSDGCWERYAGKNALEWYYFRISGFKASPIEISLLASDGNIQALEAFREYGRWVGIGLANLANSLSPEGFFIGGGLSTAMKHFEASGRLEFNKRCKHPWNVSLLENSPSAGAFGAAYMALQQC